MDPVYAGAIAGMTLIFGGFVCGLGIFIYKECQVKDDAHYEEV
jgi:hypothetical protein